MSYRSILGATGVVSGFAVTGVVMLFSHWKKVESCRAKLNGEYANVLEELRSLDDLCLKEAEDLRNKKKETTLLHEAVDSIWEDRLARYRQTNKELHSYLKALPEALGALKGLTSHYQHMASEMRKFVAFDVACSKVHNFALLLEHGNYVGIKRVSETIRQLLIAEPLVQVVCDSVSDTIYDASCPSSIVECSESFLFCMTEFDNAVESAMTRYLEFHRDNGEKAPNALLEGLHKLSSEVKANTLTSGDIIMQKERKALRDLLLRDKRQLHTVEDLASAVKYVEDVSNKLHKKDKKNNGIEETIAKDEAVTIAQEQLLLWRKSAALFLIQQQAKEALNAYQILLAETLTKGKSK